ncbi:hypothetical protein OG625_00780 [Streptomyces sp. NBC_01351]|uniref:hypothetical protein n=1 Tax=Streptomyces sp. NBC_01351 TaxID=2903833 RepID=UPI002E337465|nr:hypothetical protein [Streptomyces sp. NBC_01351]
MLRRRSPRTQRVIVEPEVLGAGLSLYDLGLYVKVSEYLLDVDQDISVDDFITPLRRGTFGQANSEAELRAGLQRIADAGLLDLDDHEDGVLAHLLAERIKNLPPYSPPSQQRS